MPFTLKLPKLSPTMEEGTLVKWHKQEGDFVKEGDLLLELATDKATVEYNALDEGYLRKIFVLEGEDAAVGQLIALFTKTADEAVDFDAFAEKKQPLQKEQEPLEEKRQKKEEPSAFLQATSTQPRFSLADPIESLHFPSSERGEKIKASPLAKKIAQEKGLDLASVSGSGPGGRVVAEDLEKASEQGEFRFPSLSSSCEKAAGSYKEVPLTQMRKAIAKKLQEAKAFIPHFYINVEIDAENLVSFRSQLVELGLKVSFNDCIVKACAFALRKHLKVNAAFAPDQNSTIQFETVDICVAVGIDAGLITPIIRFADCKSLGQISQEVKALSKKAKEGKLKEEQYLGGSFTVSNLGMYGVHDFQAILNPPQAAILAVGGILDKPVVREGQIVPGKLMNLTLSCDHRVVDGVLAAQFLQTLKRYLENPLSLLLA